MQMLLRHRLPRRPLAASLAALAGLALSAAPPAPASAAPPAPVAVTSVRTGTGGLLDGDRLDALTIPRAQRLMDGGRLSSHTLTASYLDRIRRLDRQLGAVLRVNPRALREAAASDLVRRRAGARSQLEGIPVLLKDNVDTADLPTTAGSRALLGSRPAADATLVSRLRAGGAVVLGKANLSEWANFRGTGATSGWSAVGGLTANPHVLDRNPCGSSSGSATGVAASLAQVAIGTETDGSIVCPAGTTGVVGHKPTLGLVSRAGVVPISARQDTAGPIARHVVDAALTLQVLQGRDPQDPATAGVPAGVPDRYRPDPAALRGARLGVWRLAGIDPAADAVVDRSLQALRDAGATLVEVDLPQQELFADETTALRAEFHRDIDAYLAATPGRHPADLAGLVAFNEADPVELRHFGQDTFLAALNGPAAHDPVAVAARERATGAARAMIDGALAAHDLDAIVAPTNGLAWVTDLEHGDNFVGPSSSTPPAVAGYPNVTVPAGLAGPLPVGLSFLGARWSDAELLSLAAAFESATRARAVPRLLPTLPDPAAAPDPRVARIGAPAAAR
jgi:amidase